MKSVCRMKQAAPNTGTVKCSSGNVNTAFAVSATPLYRLLREPSSTRWEELRGEKMIELSTSTETQSTRFAIHDATTKRGHGIFSRLFLVASILFLCVGNSQAQAGGAISGQWVTPGGTPASYAQIYICPYTANGIPCYPQSLIYSDSSLASPYLLPQPYSLDQYGNGTVWVSPGSYIIQVQVNQTTVYSYAYTVGSSAGGGGGDLGVIFNVVDYGAVGGQDSTAAFNNAITAAIAQTNLQQALTGIGGAGGQATVIVPADPTGLPYLLSSTWNIGTPGAGNNANYINIDFVGGVVECMMATTPCVQVMGTKDTLNNPILMPGAQSTAAGIYITGNLATNQGGMGAVLNSPVFQSNTGNCSQTGPKQHGCYFANDIFNGNDEGPLSIYNPAVFWKTVECDSTYCGSWYYNDGDIVDVDAGELNLVGGSLTLNCGQNGITSGGFYEVYISGSVIQGYPQWGVKSNGQVLVDGGAHVEAGACPNPYINNINLAAGFIIGRYLSTSDSALGRSIPIFTATGTTGSTRMQYWVIDHNAVQGDTAPLPYATVSNGTTDWSGTSVTLYVPTFPVGDTCTLMRTPESNGVVPYPSDGASDVVATGLSCGSTSNTYWSYTDTVLTSALTVKTFQTNNVYNPTLYEWPGAVILTSIHPTLIGEEGTYSGPCFNPMNIVTTQNYSINNINKVFCTDGSEISSAYAAWSPIPMIAVGAYVYLGDPVALYLPNIFNGTDPTIQGVQNYGTSGVQDVIEVVNGNPYATLATFGGRAPSTVKDIAIGQAKNGYGGLRAQTGWCTGIGFANFNTSNAYQECLTAAAKTFTVPVTSPSFNGALLISCTTGSITPSSSAGGIASGTCTLGTSSTGKQGVASATDGSVQGNVIPQVSISGTTATVTLTTILAGSPTAKTYEITVF